MSSWPLQVTSTRTDLEQGEAGGHDEGDAIEEVEGEELLKHVEERRSSQARLELQQKSLPAIRVFPAAEGTAQSGSGSSTGSKRTTSIMFTDKDDVSE